MKTCPKCGAENKPTADACRMCGTALPVSQADTAAPQPPQPPALSRPSEIPCPNCQTMNEADWSFCQQCGGKLPEAAAVPALALPHDQPTVVVPSQPKPPLSEQGLKTVPSEVSSPAEEPPPQAKSPAGFATVVDITPLDGGEPTAGGTEQVRSEPLPPGLDRGIPCPKCGRLNAADGAYCSSCGASIQVARTIVMTSTPAPSRGRLHLIMEGGQAGDVYDLKDETTLGRTIGDITFPHDGFMSGRHARVVRRGASFVLVDEESRNGTFIKIKGEVELKPGDMFLIGRQLFRFEA